MVLVLLDLFHVIVHSECVIFQTLLQVYFVYIFMVIQFFYYYLKLGSYLVHTYVYSALQNLL